MFLSPKLGHIDKMKLSAKWAVSHPNGRVCIDGTCYTKDGIQTLYLTDKILFLFRPLPKGTPIIGGTGWFNQMCPNCKAVYCMGSRDGITNVRCRCNECGCTFGTWSGIEKGQDSALCDGGIFFRYKKLNT